jgi:Uma2 family endonuclease
MITTSNKPKYDGLKVTNAEYMLLEDDGFKYDMIEGVLHLAPSPFEPHMDYAGELFSEIRIFVNQHKFGKAYYELDVHLPDGGDVVRPDISVVLKENKHILRKWIMGTPDLVCEVLSDSTRNDDLVRKANSYLTNGVREYWIVDTDKKYVELWKNRKDTWEKIRTDKLASEILVGFELDVVTFFQNDLV